MMIPRIVKIVVNTGIGKIGKEKEKIEEVVQSLRDITGQEPIKTISKKSIAGFKSREGQKVELYHEFVIFKEYHCVQLMNLVI